MRWKDMCHLNQNRQHLHLDLQTHLNPLILKSQNLQLSPSRKLTLVLNNRNLKLHSTHQQHRNLQITSTIKEVRQLLSSPDQFCRLDQSLRIQEVLSNKPNPSFNLSRSLLSIFLHSSNNLKKLQRRQHMYLLRDQQRNWQGSKQKRRREKIKRDSSKQKRTRSKNRINSWKLRSWRNGKKNISSNNKSSWGRSKRSSPKEI